MIQDKPEIVDTALVKVKKTFASGRTRPYHFRIGQLKSLMKGLQSMEKDFDESLRKDLGKGSFENWCFELNNVCREIHHAIANLKTWMEEEKVDTPFLVGPGQSSIIREPLGVVAILGSWNYPLVTSFSPMVDAIAAGNCVLFKPSEISAHTATVCRRLFIRFLDSSSYVCLIGQV